jgi:hypothetical protein
MLAAARTAFRRCVGRYLLIRWCNQFTFKHFLGPHIMPFSFAAVSPRQPTIRMSSCYLCAMKLSLEVFGVDSGAANAMFSDTKLKQR